MGNQAQATELPEPVPVEIEGVGLGEITSLARPPRDGRDVMLLVAEDPLCRILLELAHANGYDAFACETPLDTIEMLIEVGNRVACAIVSSSARWADGLGEFLADEYPQIERILVEG